MKRIWLPISILILIIGGSVILFWKVFQNPQDAPQIQGLEKSQTSLVEARFWERLSGGKVQCQLCPNKCILGEGQRGQCKARENQSGSLYSLVYGKAASAHIDPIEKKPFNHFLPGSKAFSIGTAGCGLSCKYCQNWEISQRFPEDLDSMDLPPEKVVDQALKSGSDSIAYTYSEPTVFYEYMFDTAKLAHEKGLKNVMVSSGYINPEPLKQLIPYMDAVKIDLKGFNEDFYRDVVGGKLEPILENLKIVHESGTWLEVVNLVVPDYNDDLEEIREMCVWIKDNLGEDVPLHFSRFHPDYKLQNVPATPEETLKKARQICMDEGLNYVYTGNILDPEGQATYCPGTEISLITRKGHTVVETKLDEEGQSEECSVEIPGVWSK